MVHFQKAMMLIFAYLAALTAGDKNFKPVDELTGADTLIEQPMATMMTKESEFIAVWREHKQIVGPIPASPPGYFNGDYPPKVDFKKYVVIAYFGGAGRGIDGYTVASVKQDKKDRTNVVTITPHFIGSSNILTNSYGMWVFPRPKNAVQLELVVDVQNGQAQTRKLGRFEPPKPEK